jgi:hypothetical protein
MKLSLALQQALVAHLLAYRPLTDALGGPHIHDAPPHRASDASSPAWLVIGDETVTAWSTRTTDGAEHEIVLSLWTSLGGYAPLKVAMAALHDALHETPLTLPGGAVVSMRFLAARTSREARGRLRRADCRFRLLVEHDPES